MSDLIPPVNEQASTSDLRLASVARRLWDRLREMRSVFWLLSLIAGAALLCAVIPQGESADQYYERYGRFGANLVLRLGLSHVHTVWWFLALLGLLLLSLAACSGRLWTEARRRWRLPEPGVPDRATADALEVALPAARAVRLSELTARHHGYRLTLLPAADGDGRLYAVRHRLSAWGPALAHYAVFLIALGAVLGSVPGLAVDRVVHVEEGTVYRATLNRPVDGHSPAAGSPDDPGEVPLSLPFDIRVDRFTIDQDPQTGEVRNYYSEVRLLDGERELAGGTVSVNHPLRYRGYYLSQSSWRLGHALVEVRRGAKTDQVGFALARYGQEDWGAQPEERIAQLADGKQALMTGGFEPSAVRDGKNLRPAADGEAGRPALHLVYVSPRPGAPMPFDLKELGWLLQGETRPLPGGSVTFVAVSESTGLGIRKDPGLPLVIAGFIACTLGLMMIFYFPLQRCLITVRAHDDTSCSVGFNAYARAGGGDERHPLWTAILAELPAADVPTKETSSGE